MTISDALTGGSPRLPLWFRVPDEFVPIDPDESVEDRVDRIIDQSSLLPGIDERQQLSLVYAQEALHRQLAEAGAVYAAHCNVRSEHAPRLATALFAVMVTDVPALADQSMTVIARGMTEPGQPTEVLLADYPAGQAVVRGEQLLVHWNGKSHSMRQAQVMFRLPDRRRLATLSMSSSHLEDWDDFVSVLNQIARTVTFVNPHTAMPTISNVLSGGL